MQWLLCRGIFMLILGLLTISLIVMYFYYYFNNQLINSTNKDQYLIFGPTSILIMLLILNIVTLFYCIYLFIMHTNNAFQQNSISSRLKQKCGDYRQFTGVVKKKLSKFLKS